MITRRPVTPPAHPVARHTNASLQGLRGLAAFTVMMYHMHFMSAKVGFTQACTASWAENVGPYAVLLFFCISGYLIVGSLTRHGDLKKFAFNRIARLYPLFLILHLIIFMLGPWMGYEWMGSLRHDGWAYAGHFISNLALLPGITTLPIAQKNAWSLSYEALFYILVGTLFTGYKRWSTPLGKATCIIGLITCIIACYVQSRMIFFGMGALVWWLDEKGHLKMPTGGPFGLLCGILGLALLSTGHYWLTTLAVIPFFIDVVRQTGWLKPVLTSQFMGWLGKISYSLYLLHPFVLDPLRRLGLHLADHYGPALVHSLFIVTGSILAIACAALSHELIEQRLTKWLVRR